MNKSSSERNLRWTALIIALVVSFAVSLLPFGHWILYPFKLFTTWAHECSHALMAFLVGGEIQKIVLNFDTSGLAVYRMAEDSFLRALVTNAGYLGAAFFGCLLLAGTRIKKPNILFGFLALLMLASLILWVRNAFGMVSVFLMTVSLFLLAKYVNGKISNFVLSFLAVQVALNSLFDIRVLFGLAPGQNSDAQTMASLFFLPTWFWAGLWMILSFLMLLFTLYATRKRSYG